MRLLWSSWKMTLHCRWDKGSTSLISSPRLFGAIWYHLTIVFCWITCQVGYLGHLITVTSHPFCQDIGKMASGEHYLTPWSVAMVSLKVAAFPIYHFTSTGSCWERSYGVMDWGDPSLLMTLNSTSWCQTMRKWLYRASPELDEREQIEFKSWQDRRH